MKKLKSKNNLDLSIVIVSYNTAKILDDCLATVNKIDKRVKCEVIVSDNCSSDGSVKMIRRKYPKVKLIENETNLGFSKANNKAKSVVRGEYVLFLNSDTLVPKNTIFKALLYMKENEHVGALTVKTVLPNGSLDKDARRSFPTPWVAFTHFSGLDRIFSKSKIFTKYWYGYMSPEMTHEVDVVQGAFFLTKKSLLDQVEWFSEDYFLDGEDIDLCWKIKKSGYKIMYYPKVNIVHIKKASKKISKNNKQVLSGVNAMELFYRKNMWNEYPYFVNVLVIVAINILKLVRLGKVAVGI